jgi:hypothetical protein
MVYQKASNFADIRHFGGFLFSPKGEKKAYIHIGPKFGTVSKQAVNEAVKECRNRGDADWLIILGFCFESNIANENVTTSIGSFEVTKLYGHKSHPIEITDKNQKIAVRVISQFGEEVMKVLGV